MKKLFTFAAVAFAALMIASCSGRSGADGVTPSPEAGPDGIVELSEADYYAPGRPVDRLTVIDFGAVWCGPCRAFKPVFHEAAEKFKGKATFVSVDIDSMPQLMIDFNLKPVVPTVLFIQPDGTYESYAGTGDLLPDSVFFELVQKHLDQGKK